MTLIKPTGLFLFLFSCLLSLSLTSRGQVAPGQLPTEPVLAPAGTRLTAPAVVFTPASYDLLRQDYLWQQQALELKAQRLRQAAAADSTSHQLLATGEHNLAEAQERIRALEQSERTWQQRCSIAQAARRPTWWADGRLYLGGGVGLVAGAAGLTYLWVRYAR